MQEAGAAAIELNVYYLPGDPRMPGRDVEQRYVDILTTVKATVSIPVAVKLAPFFSSAGEVTVRLDRAGADGLVVFNRFMQTDIDPETLTVSTGLKLSDPAEAALPRSWIARLRGLVGASLAASTGVETAADVAETAAFTVRRLRARGLSRLDRVVASRADVAVMHHRLARTGVLAECRRRGIKTMVWTVNGDQALARWLARPDVDVLVTDRPARAIALRDRWGRAMECGLGSPGTPAPG